MSIREAAYAVLEVVLNRYLRLDPAALQRLAPLSGRLIRLEIKGLDVDIFLLPHSEGLQVYPEFDGEPDCTLSGTPLGFVRLGSGERADRLFDGTVDIRGDTEIGQQFGEVLADLDIDWEEHLSHLTGDVAAHQVGRAARAAGRWGREVGQTLTQDLQEYLQEEVRLLPTRIENEEFADAVDALRDDLERLEARIQRLRSLRKGEGGDA
jgi:ubiquinone biosynthesis protein UbiJ